MYFIFIQSSLVRHSNDETFQRSRPTANRPSGGRGDPLCDRRVRRQRHLGRRFEGQQRRYSAQHGSDQVKISSIMNQVINQVFANTHTHLYFL